MTNNGISWQQVEREFKELVADHEDRIKGLMGSLAAYVDVDASHGIDARDMQKTIVDRFPNYFED